MFPPSLSLKDSTSEGSRCPRATTVVASSHKARTVTLTKLRTRGLQFEKGRVWFRGLGVDSGTASQKRRVATLAKRLRRLKTLASRKHPSPQRSGIQTCWPAVGCGISGHGVAPSVIRGMRTRTTWIANCRRGSWCTTVNALVPEFKDPVIVIPCQTVIRTSLALVALQEMQCCLVFAIIQCRAWACRLDLFVAASITWRIRCGAPRFCFAFPFRLVVRSALVGSLADSLSLSSKVDPLGFRFSASPAWLGRFGAGSQGSCMCHVFPSSCFDAFQVSGRRTDPISDCNPSQRSWDVGSIF